MNPVMKLREIRKQNFTETFTVAWERRLNTMVNFYKDAFFKLFVVQMLIRFSSPSYDIYRGDIDNFSRNLVEKIPGNIKCEKEAQYCSCDTSQTFIYGKNEEGKATVKCTDNNKFRRESNCKQFSNSESIKIVGADVIAPPQDFVFSAQGVCDWKNTEYTKYGNNTNWLPVEGNPGDISVQDVFFRKEILINDPTALVRKFSGMLLKLQIQCVSGGFFGPQNVNSICLLLKIEGRTNITSTSYFPTTSPTTTASTTPTSSTTSSSSSSTAQTSHSKDLNRNPSITTPKVTTSPLSITAIPSDPENGKSEGDDNSSSLVPILVPILLTVFLVIVLIVIFLYRRRQRLTSANIKKDVYEENTLPQHAALTKNLPNSLSSYAVPGSQINTTPLYDTVDESTNPPHERAPNYYELEDDYATCNEPIPTISDSNAAPSSPQSTDVYQEIDSDKVEGSTLKSGDNLGYSDRSTEDPYYHSLEDGTSNENVYDKVTEEPRSPDHLYNVLEKPN